MLCSFEIVGKFAHWRKYDTNSSSLSYYFPTRTNLIGLLGSILELPRDSYYNLFGEDKLNIGLVINSKLRKKMTVLNYRQNIPNAKFSNEDFYTYSQIKQELLLPDFFDNQINYRIYLKPIVENLDENEKIIYNNLFLRLKNGDIGYGIYLGQRQFRGDLINFKGDLEVTMKETNIINSIIKFDGNISEADLNYGDHIYVIENMPMNFNKNRELSNISTVAANINNTGILLKKDVTAYEIKSVDYSEIVLFI